MNDEADFHHGTWLLKNMPESYKKKKKKIITKTKAATSKSTHMAAVYARQSSLTTKWLVPS